VLASRERLAAVRAEAPPFIAGVAGVGLTGPAA
jgi:hypothetical protein